MPDNPSEEEVRFVHRKECSLGAVEIVLIIYPRALASDVDANLLIAEQVRMLHEFANNLSRQHIVVAEN